ncbi:hypothetical protein SUGI_1165220 [Cryptomeria japonica]|nr:hypothetical protein SUGI_1165220 [Cryptomeria japonica]
MSPEGLLRAGASSRVEKLLGSLPHNNISNPAPSEAGDLNELREEDVWEAWVEGSNPVHESTVKEEISRHKTDGGVGSGGGGGKLQLQQQQPQPQPQPPPPQQRWLGFETGGLSVAFEDSAVRSRFSPLTRTSKSFKMASPSASRSMSVRIADNGSRHMLMHQSAPVNVPDWSKILGIDHRKDNPNGFPAAGDEDEDEGDDKLPPHEYLAREQARSQMTTTSVFHGVGRTLKGRDMSRVRNAVWRQTGFLG